jgi:ABC-type transport system involved in multi-copper enzyme maturation permease subunit
MKKMFRAVITKTLFEKRWVIVCWALVLLISNFLLIQLFPPLRDAFSSMTANLPPELAGWFGQDGEIWATLKGYIGMEIVGQMGLVAVAFGIIFTLSMVPADEQNGTILTQLSKPLSRPKLYLSKYIVFLLSLVIVMLGFWLGTWLGALIVDPISISELLQPMLAVILLTLVFATLTYAVATLGVNKAIAGVIVGVYALFGYFINSMQGDVDILKTLSSMTPFEYYNTPNVMFNSMDINHVLILLAAVAVSIIISLPVFCKRDLNTKR